MERGPEPQIGSGDREVVKSFEDLETLKERFTIGGGKEDTKDADLSPLQPFANYDAGQSKVTLGEVNVDTRSGDDKITEEKTDKSVSDGNEHGDIEVPSYVPEADLASAEKQSVLENGLKDVEKSDLIANAGDYTELLSAIDKIGTVPSSQGSYAPKELKDLINQVVTGKKTLDYITRTYGLRDAVNRLIDQVAVEDTFLNNDKYEAYADKRTELLENGKSFRALEKDYQTEVDNFYNQSGLAGNFNKVKSFLGFRPQLPKAVQQKRDEYVKAKAAYARLLNDSLQLRSEVERVKVLSDIKTGEGLNIERFENRSYNQEDTATKAAFLQKFVLKPNQELLAKQEVYLLNEDQRAVRDRLLQKFMSSKYKTPVLIGGGALLVASGGLSTLAAMGAGFGVRRLTRGGVEKAEADRDKLKQSFSLDKLEEQESNLLSAEETLRVKKRNRKYLSAAAAAAAGGLVNTYGDGLANSLSPISRAEASIDPEVIYGNESLDIPSYIDLTSTDVTTPDDSVIPGFNMTDPVVDEGLPESDFESDSTLEVPGEIQNEALQETDPTTADITTDNTFVRERLTYSDRQPDLSSVNNLGAPREVDRALSFGEVRSPDSFETVYQTGQEITPDIEVVPHEYVVTRGDRLWKIVEREFPDYLRDLNVSQRNAALDALFKTIQNDPETLQIIGLQSGNVDLIYPGESLDLSPLGEKLRSVVQERFGVSVDSIDTNPDTYLETSQVSSVSSNPTPELDKLTEAPSPENATESEVVKAVIPNKPTDVDLSSASKGGAVTPTSEDEFVTPVTEKTPGADIPDGTPLAPGVGENISDSISPVSDTSVEIDINELTRSLHTPVHYNPEVLPNLSEVRIPSHEELIVTFGSEEAYSARVREIIAQIEDVHERGFFARLLGSGDNSYDLIAGTPVEEVVNLAEQGDQAIEDALADTDIKPNALRAWAKFVQGFSGSHLAGLKLEDLVAIYAVRTELGKSLDTENFTLLKAENLPTTAQLEEVFGNLNNLQQIINSYTSQVEGFSQEELSQRLADNRTVFQQISERSIDDLLALHGQPDEVLKSVIPSTPENTAALRAWLKVIEDMKVRGEVSLWDTLVSSSYHIKLQEK